MTNRHSPPARLKTRLEHLLALDEAPLGRVRVDAAELEAIRDVLAQGTSAARRVNLARAMFIAADNAPDERSALLIGRILQDPGAEAPLRLQAAAVLGDILHGAASRALAESLANADSSPGLQATVLQALAKVGEPEALRAIEALGPATSKPLARLREVARATIQWRSGTKVDERAKRALLPAGETVAVRQEKAAAVKSVIEHLRGSTWGLRFNSELAYSFECESTRQLLLLSSDLQRGKLIASLTARQHIAGLVVMPDDSGPSPNYVARRLVLTRPEGDDIEVSVLGIDGTLLMLGRARLQGDVHVLALQPIGGNARPYVVVDGTLDDERLVLQMRVFAGAPSGERHGEVDPAAV